MADKGGKQDAKALVNAILSGGSQRPAPPTAPDAHGTLPPPASDRPLPNLGPETSDATPEAEPPSTPEPTVTRTITHPSAAEAEPPSTPEPTVTRTMAHPSAAEAEPPSTPEPTITRTMVRAPGETESRPDTERTAASAGHPAAQALVAAALSSAAPAAGAAASSVPDPAAHATDKEAAALIDVYFELEAPAERDALFDQIAQLDTPLVLDFFRAMMAEDHDEYVRAAATAELARRGDGDALQALTADLEDPAEPFFFTHAVQILGEVLGQPFYDTLSALWQDPNRDADQRREAMVGMESLAPERALPDFVAFLDGIRDIAQMPDDQVEVAMAAFVRNGYPDGRNALSRLQQRVATSDLDPYERAELTGFIQEGMALLEAPPA